MLARLGLFQRVHLYRQWERDLNRRRAAVSQRQIETVLPQKFALDTEIIKVLVLTRPQLQAIIDKKPKGFGEQPAKYHSDAIFMMGIGVTEALQVFTPREEVTRSGRGWRDLLTTSQR